MMPRLLLVEDDPRLGPLVADELGEQWAVTLCADGESRSMPLRRTTSTSWSSTVDSPASTAPPWSRPSDSDASAPPCSCLLPSVRSRTESPGWMLARTIPRQTVRLRRAHRPAPSAHTRLHRRRHQYRDRRLGLLPRRQQHHLPIHRAGDAHEKETALLRLLAGEPARAFTGSTYCPRCLTTVNSSARLIPTSTTSGERLTATSSAPFVASDTGSAPPPEHAAQSSKKPSCSTSWATASSAAPTDPTTTNSSTINTATTTHTPTGTTSTATIVAAHQGITQGSDTVSDLRGRVTGAAAAVGRSARVRKALGDKQRDAT